MGTALEDGDSAPGQVLLVGTPVTWTYLVTNHGNVAVTFTLSDDHGTAPAGDDFTPVYVDGDVNHNGKFDPGETWLYTSATAVTYTARAGQYVNAVTLTTTQPDGTTLTRRERSFHFGATMPLVLVKSVNAANPLAPTSHPIARSVSGYRFFATVAPSTTTCRFARTSSSLKSAPLVTPQLRIVR